MYAYKYILRTEQLHWDNIKTDYMDLGPLLRSTKQAFEAIQYKVDKDAQEAYIDAVKAEAKRTGVAPDPEAVCKEVNKQGRIVLDIERVKSMEVK